ncbi:MAG: polyprenyl diphosphate synthase [Gammaproteobacteria bacterium]|nr:polyprenyl diphosphate synthase [Gammaproteobacteria bacterium]MCY4278571.1 polyprenyl diphosphate synthase [Gammaproteobacteria bacterium]
MKSPNHIAIIMDGNYRWARKRGLPVGAGHRAGAENVRPRIMDCLDRGVGYLTLFAFSTENWQRPKSEVRVLMNLVRRVLDDELSELAELGLRIRVIGDRMRFSDDLLSRIERVEHLSEVNSKMTLTVALSYGGRWDILQAMRAVAKAVLEGRVSEADIEDMDEETFGRFLSLERAGVPQPDLLIRTGREQRLSNFCIWDLSYTELYFTDTLWPDFSVDDLDAAIAAYGTRLRRFGDRGGEAGEA